MNDQLTYRISKSAAPLSLQHHGAQPVHLQLKAQIALQVRSGALPAGTRLPPVRKLADAIGVNRNTVLKVYTALEQAGLVVSRVGSGTFVAAVHKAATSTLSPTTCDRLRQVIINAFHEGATPYELRLVFESELGAATQIRNARAVDVVLSRRRFSERESYGAHYHK